MKASLDKAVNLYLKKVGELSIIRRLTDSISLEQDPKKARHFILDILTDEMDIGHASIMLYDDETGGLVIKAASPKEKPPGPERDPRPGGRFMRGEGVAGMVFEERIPILVNDVDEDSRFLKVDWQRVEIGSLMCLPLVVRDKLVGVLNLSHPEKNVFDREDEFGMMIVANQVAILLDNACNFGRIRDLNRELEEKVRERTEELVAYNEKLMREIVERKRAQEALRMTQFCVENLADAVFWMGPDASFSYVNKAACSALGYSREELLSMSVPDIDPDYPQDRWKENWEAIRELGSQTIESRHKRKDGSIFPVEITDNFMEFEGKEFNFAVARDITERRRAEAALKESEASYANLVNSLPAVVFKGHLDWSVDFFDDKIEEITGYPKEEFDSRRIKWCDVVLEEDLEEMSRTFVKAIGASGSYVREYRIRDRDGNIRWVQGRGQIIRDERGKIDHMTGVFFDITDLKRMEDELSKVEKLESVGVLAGGIAHDFNNLLAAIVGNVSLAKMMINPQDRESLDALDDAERASQRARDLTKQLLTFAKGGAPVKETASMGEIIKDSCSFSLRGSNVRCELSLPDDLWPVEIDVGQMSQVINNLLINADQAMPEGGILRVRAEGVTVDAQKQIPVGEGRYVRITIEDEGIGIPEKYLAKIFDPFFTTKRKGSGLGLTTAYSIVRNHDGHITVESKVGGGTTFHVFLPASDRPLPKKAESEDAPAPGEGRVLVMDDEEMVRNAAGKMLSRMGYDVEYAQDGQEALTLYEEALDAGLRFSAVLLDLTVPGGMGGRDAVTRLLEMDPDVVAIVSSGYSTDPVMSDYKWYGFKGVVAKPYEYAELARVVSRAISGGED